MLNEVHYLILKIAGHVQTSKTPYDMRGLTKLLWSQIMLGRDRQRRSILTYDSDHVQ